MPRASKAAAVEEFCEWLTKFCTEIGLDLARGLEMIGDADDHFRSVPRRKRMTPAEEEWLEQFGEEYGIPPGKRQAAYDALRAEIPPDRRKLAKLSLERRFQKLCGSERFV